MKGMISMKTLYTLPMIPTPTPTAPPGVGELLTKLLGWLMYGGMAAVVAGFIVGGITLSIENRNGQASENMKRIMYVAIGAIIIGSASALAGALLRS